MFGKYIAINSFLYKLMHLYYALKARFQEGSKAIRVKDPGAGPLCVGAGTDS